ncbi:YdeI/OmpD-associated family protein [Micromonospora vinacea]|uniref:YdeI/OmpD-associated family protein n=1 Tax=Micromonospora vinacea TaxID=709878 RepID=UPI003D942DB2
MASTELDELIVADAEALRAWLAANHATSPGVWLALTKKGGTVTTVTWQQAVDEGLCVGWIDGQARKRDEESSWIRFTPRRPRSSWSQRNVANVARLEEQGRMLPAGRAAVEAAKADGRWAAAYAPPSEAEVPADLLAAIAAEPAAQAMLDVLTKANRFALIHRLNAVKRAETRERKIGEFVAMLARHETFYPQKARPVSGPTPPSTDATPSRTD